LEGSRVTAKQAFTELEEDALALESLKRMADELLPSLEKDYEDIVAKLEKEQAELAEIIFTN
jgi:kinetochore protein Spc7/SPC105